MRNLVVFAALVAVGYSIWKYESGRRTDRAIRVARTQEVNAGLSKPAPRQAVYISTMVAPWVEDLFSEISLRNPDDLVPPLTVAQQRIQRSRALVEPEKRPIYDMAVAVLSKMIPLAEERTKVVEAMLQSSANDKSSLDSKGTLSASKAFFVESTTRRWNEIHTQAKPAIDQLLQSLKTAEQRWSASLPADSRVDEFGLASLEPVRVTISTKDMSSSSLETSKVNQTRTLYPWRQAYYEQHGR